MIFGHLNNRTLIVAAADNFAEMAAFHASAVSASHLFTKAYQPSNTDMVLDERFYSFQTPPYVFDFESPEQMAVFAKEFSVNVVSSMEVLDRHNAMMKALRDDQFSIDSTENRTIGEIYGLEESDPWDARTEDQIKEDAENKKEAEEKKKAGKLTDDSFAGGKKNEKKARVTDINTKQHADGSVTVDNVLAVKGVYDDNGKGAWLPEDQLPPAIEDAEPEEVFYRFDMEKRSGDLSELIAALQGNEDALILYNKHSAVLRGEILANRMHELLITLNELHTVMVVDANHQIVGAFEHSPEISQHITPGGHIAIYHRCDVTSESWNVVLGNKLLENMGPMREVDFFENHIVACGQLVGSFWYACATKTGAELIQAVFEEAGQDFTEIEVYGVNDLGERLVPKGVELVEYDPNFEHPRPWNERAAEWFALSEEERKTGEMRIKADEFLFCGQYNGAQEGTTIYIVPRVYFHKHNDMWDQSFKDLLELPGDMKEEAPGVYRTRSRDWIAMTNYLSKLGMDESLSVQLYINLL